MVEAIERVVLLKHMVAGDLPRTQVLLSQLGYIVDAQELSHRYDAVIRSGDHALIVAEENGPIVAFCHVYARPALDKLPEAVVQALVVDHVHRRKGIGRRMMAAAESWSVNRGFTSGALASHVSRAAAHSFYENRGYRCEAMSHLFHKTVY